MLSFRPMVSTIDINGLKKTEYSNTELENFYCKGKVRENFEMLGG